MPTIIQSLKKIKQLSRKIERTNKRIGRWCSYTDDEVPLYETEEVRKMIQSCDDMQNEISKLRHAMHLVNATLEVEFDGKKTTIDELLLEANVSIPAKLVTQSLIRRKEKDRYSQPNPDVNVVLQFDPKERDKRVDYLTDRQADINDFLDTVNIKVEV